MDLLKVNKDVIVAVSYVEAQLESEVLLLLVQNNVLNKKNKKINRKKKLNYRCFSLNV